MKRKRQVGELYSQLSHMLFTGVQKISKLQEYLRWKKAKIKNMDIIRGTTKCIAALVCSRCAADFLISYAYRQ